MSLDTPLYHILITIANIFKIGDETIKNRFDDSTTTEEAIKNYKDIAIQKEKEIFFYTENENKAKKFKDSAKLLKINQSLKHNVIIKMPNKSFEVNI